VILTDFWRKFVPYQNCLRPNLAFLIFLDLATLTCGAAVEDERVEVQLRHKVQMLLVECTVKVGYNIVGEKEVESQSISDHKSCDLA